MDGQDPVRRVVEGMIRRAIEGDWLHKTGVASVELTPPPESGSTDAVTFEAQVNLRFFVKFHQTDAERELEGYRVLEAGPHGLREHLVPPLDLRSSEFLWLAPLANQVVTLHKLVGDQDVPLDWITRLHEDVLSANRSLWRATRSSTPSPDLLWATYGKRVDDRIGDLEQVLGLPVGGLADLEIEVNGESQGRFDTIWTRFKDLLHGCTIPPACTIHGDEHAKNVLVRRSAIRSDSTGWYIIDYVNARAASDWLFSIAKMLQWWEIYSILDLAKSQRELVEELHADHSVDERKRKLVVRYDRTILDRVLQERRVALSRQIRQAAADTAIDFDEDASWRRRLELAYFAVVFGAAWRQTGSAEFALPVMIGEGLRALSRAAEL